MKNKLLKTGVILVSLLLLCVVMVGAGAAELKDVTNDSNITIKYWESADEYNLLDYDYALVTKVLEKVDYQNFFGTSKIYTFSTADDINKIAENVENNIDYWGKDITYIQVADIDCSGKEMKSIPGWLCQFNMYGNGHYIANYKQTANKDKAHGLIESIGHIKDEDYSKYRCTLNGIVMSNCKIESEADSVGAIVGKLEGGELRMIGCSVENSTIKTTGDYLGGLIGRLQHKYVTGHGYTSGRLFIYKCNVTGCKIMSDGSKTFSDGSYVGGLVGDASEMRTYIFLFNTLVSSSKIGGNGQYVGGIGGYVSDIDIKKSGLCVNNCILEAAKGSVGGLFGCAKKVAVNKKQYDHSSLVVVSNTAILTDDSYAGTIVGDVSVSWESSVNFGDRDNYDSFGSNRRVRLTNCFVCGDRKIHQICPSYGDGYYSDYKNGGMYYASEEYYPGSVISGEYWYLTSDSTIKSKVTTVDNSGASTEHWTYKDFGKDFVKYEYNAEGGVSQVILDTHNIANIGKYGYSDGYGYFEARPVTVTYHLTTTEYPLEKEGEPEVTTTSWSVSQNENRYANEPVIEVSRGYNFDGWYTDEALTQKWDFKSQKLTGNLDLYAKKTEKTYTLEYRKGKTINNIGYTQPVTLEDYPSSEGEENVGCWSHEYGREERWYKRWLPGEQITGEQLSEFTDISNFYFYAESLPASKVSLLIETGIKYEDTTIQTVTAGSTFTRPASNPKKGGYTFKGWYNALDPESEFDFSKVYETNQKVYAKWEENNYTVKFNKNSSSGKRLNMSSAADEGEMPDLNGVLYTQDRAVPVNTYENDGYTFMGWNTEPDGTGTKITDNINVSELEDDTGDTVTLYAQWVPSYLTLDFEMNDHGVLKIPSQEYAYGRQFQEPPEDSLTDTGYTFKGWYTDNTFTEEFDFDEIYTENKTAYAKWEENHYTIEFDGNEGTGSVSPQYAGYTDEMVLPSEGVFTREGFTFTEWNTKSDGTGIPYPAGGKVKVSELISKDSNTVTLYAQWVSNDKCSLRFDMNGQGNQIQSMSTEKGSGFTRPADPSELGYVFQDWYDENGNVFNFTGPYSENKVAYAKWENAEIPIYVWDGSRYINVKDLGTSGLAGKVIYSESDGVLTLNGYNVDSSGVTSNAAICSLGENDLILHLAEGSENTIGTSSSASYAGIVATPGSIRIGGTGTLTVYTKAPSGETDMSMGIYSTRDVIINGGTILLKPTDGTPSSSILGECGIWGGNSVEINNGTVDIQVKNSCEGSYGIFGQNSLKISGGTTKITGGQIGAASTGIITMTDGTFTTEDNEIGLLANTGINLDEMYSGSVELDNKDRAFVLASDIPATATLGSKTVTAGPSKEEASSWTNPGFADLVNSQFNYVKIIGNPVEKYSVNIESGGNGSVNRTSVASVEKGTKITFASNELHVGKTTVVATANEGYEFKEWINIPEYETVTEDCTITASFKEPSCFTITFQSNDTDLGYVSPFSYLSVQKGVSIVSDGDRVRVMETGGDSVIADITATAKDGCTFVNWSGLPGSGVVAGNVIVTANFTTGTTVQSSSSVTSFFGEKDGNDFTFEKAVVITKATLPGATYATVTNTSGSGWYTCNLTTDSISGNGVLYFQVPLDVINVKGWTVNDVSVLGCKTTYLTSEGGYAKYSAVITKDGSLTIDFEKDAAVKAVEKVQEVVEQKQTATEQKQEAAEKVQEVVEQKQTTQTAAKSPFPVLGILAGLGIAGVLVMRRK